MLFSTNNVSKEAAGTPERNLERLEFEEDPFQNEFLKKGSVVAETSVFMIPKKV
jgi:hypothetical protein